MHTLFILIHQHDKQMIFKMHLIIRFEKNPTEIILQSIQNVVFRMFCHL